MTRKKLTKIESADLERLLLKVIQSGRWWPNEKTFQLAHGIISAWAPELVITRSSGSAGWRTQKEILLTVYGGGAKKLRGLWHLPGGYDTWQLPDIAADCQAIAKRELGVNIKYVKVLDAYKWKPKEHPYGRPLSLYVECKLINKLREAGSIKFFALGKLPKRMVACHKKFVKKYLAD